MTDHTEPAPESARLPLGAVRVTADEILNEGVRAHQFSAHLLAGWTVKLCDEVQQLRQLAELAKLYADSVPGYDDEALRFKLYEAFTAAVLY